MRDRLLDAADEVLFMNGSVATPVDAILRRAGASPPSLYSHFGNKEGLVTAALQRRLRVWTEVWDDQISRATTDAQRLLALWPALRVYQHDHLTERWCAFSGAAAAIPQPSAQLTAVLTEETQLLRTRLLEHARPLAGRRAKSLASALFIVYTGTMATMLREEYHVAIDEGEASAKTLVSCYATGRH